MDDWDGKAFDRWLTTEPGETCAHAGTPCGKTCLCNCEACITMNRPDEYGRVRPVSLVKDICGKCANAIPVLTSGKEEADNAS